MIRSRPTLSIEKVFDKGILHKWPNYAPSLFNLPTKTGMRTP